MGSLLQEEQAARAVEFAGALALQGQTPGWHEPSGTGTRRLSFSGGRAIAVGSVLRGSAGLVVPFPAWPPLQCVLCPLKSLLPFPSPLGTSLFSDKAREARRPPSRASHRPLLSPAGTDPAQPHDAVPSQQLSLAGGGRSGDRRRVGQPMSQRGSLSLLSLPSPLLLPRLISGLGPLCPGAWPRSPLRRLPRIVPAPRSVKPAGHRGNGAFLEAPLPKRGAAASPAQAAHAPGRAASALLATRAPPNRPGRVGDITGGSLAGSRPRPPCAGGCPWPRCVVMLCRGAEDWLGPGLAGCRAAFPEPLEKGSRLGFWAGKHVRARAAIRGGRRAAAAGLGEGLRGDRS